MTNERRGDKERFRKAAERLSADPEEAGKHLSEEERDHYRRCQESIVEARLSAQRIEGNIVIGEAPATQGEDR
jgi:hypothetical protein